MKISIFIQLTLILLILVWSCNSDPTPCDCAEVMFGMKKTDLNDKELKIHELEISSAILECAEMMGNSGKFTLKLVECVNENIEKYNLYFMSEKEYAILANKSLYLENKKDQIKPIEAIGWLDEYFMPVSELDVIESEACVQLSLEFLAELAVVKYKSKMLREKKLFLSYCAPMKSRKIIEHTDVVESDVISYGMCMRPPIDPKTKTRGIGLLSALVSLTPDEPSFRTIIKIQNQLETGVYLSLSTKDFNSMYSAIQVKGERVIFKTFDKSKHPSDEIYDYNSTYWRIKKNGNSISVIPRSAAKTHGINPYPKPTGLSDPKLVKHCGFFKTNKIHEMLNWDESKIEAKAIISNDGSNTTCDFLYPESENGFNIISSTVDLIKFAEDFLVNAYKRLIRFGDPSGFRYAVIENTEQSIILLGKRYNMFGYNKWTYIMKRQIDSKQEYIITTLSDTEDNPDLVQYLEKIIRKLE